MVIRWLSGALIAICSIFFLFGGIFNILEPASIAAEFQRWGYPSWFHAFVGSFEISAAVLLLMPGTRIFGIAMASMTMMGALATVILFNEWPCTILPLVALGFLAALTFITRPTGFFDSTIHPLA